MKLTDVEPVCTEMRDVIGEDSGGNCPGPLVDSQEVTPWGNARPEILSEKDKDALMQMSKRLTKIR